MNYSAISIQGNIVSSEILEKIRTEDIRYQKAIDFNLNPSASIRDEINLAWSLAISNWNAFKQKRENLRDTDTGTTETRRFWMVPLLSVLGYEMTISNAEIINGKSYAISHRSTNRDGFPIHIVGVNQSLDKRPVTGGTRLSPHALVQEYLNNKDEHLYGLVTNGRFLRLLRDATRLSRLSYLEFDLEQMMEEGLYVEFALLFRALHATRMPEKIDIGADSIFEFYHQEAISSGSRIRERLSIAVESSIKELANGLLYHPNNENLRRQVLENKITPKNYYLYTLRLVYRMLFLLVIEERKLIYPEKRDEVLNKKKGIYYDFYSLQRLTKLAEKLVYVDPRKTDLWQSLLTTFALFEDGQYGNKLGIDPLGSGLFSPSALNIINEQLLDNECLLKVLRYLVTFENEKGQRVRVNYADLDVEEFGSVYEGLLEYDPVFTDNLGQPIFSFVKGDGRSSSGSHYTPEELVKPLITHSLDYLIADKLKEQDPEAGLLSLTVCDVACGSGHILLSAARRIGFELAKHRSKEDQPAPTEMRKATRDVIRNCIYGVDLNSLAVELCKVALWLEAHDPGQPMNFLDHHIKCGNAIVGLAHFEELENGIASEAFKTLPDDDKEIATAFRNRNNLERQTKNQLSTYEVAKVDDDLKGLQNDFANFAQLPENTPEQIAKKDKLYQELIKGKKWWRLKQLADLQVAQFFIPKTEANKEKLTTHSQYINYLKTEAQILDRGAATAVSQNKHFFHWFLEFPQVFQNGGFDCILGNPPYKGGSKLSNIYGDYFTNYISNYYNGVAGMADLVSYFIRRYYSTIKDYGFLSIITTNKVSEGKTRESSLDFLIKSGCSINSAIKSKEWPGTANVHVSIFSVFKGEWESQYYLDGKSVKFISSLFSPEIEIGNPYKLIINNGLSYTGTKVYGEGFIIQDDERNVFIKNDPNNRLIIKQFISGDDINSHHPDNWKRWAIDLNKYSLTKAKTFTEPFNHLLKTVFPARQKVKSDKNAKEYWWKYQRERKELYDKLKDISETLVMAQTSKHIMLKPISTEKLFSVKCIIFSNYDMELYTNIQSSLHSLWAWKYGTTMGASTLQYSTTACFDTFPMAKVKSLKSAKSFLQYVVQRQEVKKCGLTEIFNELNNKETLSDFEVDELRSLYVELDETLIFSYGWQDIHLRHNFYEVEYLPENDRVRYTIHPDARKEVLKRLLLLNHERYEEEIQQGLHKKADVVAFYKQKNKEVPVGATFSDVKTKQTAAKKAKATQSTKIGNAVNEPQEIYGQQQLFEEPNLFNIATTIANESKVVIQKEDNTNFKYHITKNAVKGNFTGEFKQIATTAALSEIMLGRKAGDSFVFGGVKYVVLEVI
ncbi:MAG: DNA methyltransferase [Lutibacter sp.]|jgi:hypothetical protein